VSRRPVRTLQAVLLLASPSGGQTTARRNAWAGMSADAARGRDRRQAESALAAATQRSAAPSAHGRRDGTHR